MSRNRNNGKGKARKNTGSPYGDGFKGFVDIPLSDEDKVAVAELADMNGPALLVFILEAAEDGYKFSLTADPDHNSYIATLTGRHCGEENLGWALSARGPDSIGACVALYWKHCKTANYGAWLEAGREKNVFDDKWG